jgi:acetoacetate decarboxylase
MDGTTPATDDCRPAAGTTPKKGYWSRLAGMIAPGEWLYERAHYLASEIEIDPVAARRWIPRPLELAEPVATIFTGWFPHNTFGSDYTEAGLFLHVRHRRTKAIYSPWMLVDDDVALITGRELLGYPKKLGAIEFSVDGDRVRGVATRRGAELVRMEGRLGREVPNPPPILGRPHRNVRSAMGVALPKVIAFTPKEHPVSVREAELDVRVGGSERDPLAELGFGRVLRSRLHVVNLAAAAPPVPIAAVSPLWYVRQWLLRVH